MQCNDTCTSLLTLIGGSDTTRVSSCMVNDLCTGIKCRVRLGVDDTNTSITFSPCTSTPFVSVNYTISRGGATINHSIGTTNENSIQINNDEILNIMMREIRGGTNFRVSTTSYCLVQRMRISFKCNQHKSLRKANYICSPYPKGGGAFMGGDGVPFKSSVLSLPALCQHHDFKDWALPSHWHPPPMWGWWFSSMHRLDLHTCTHIHATTPTHQTSEMITKWLIHYYLIPTLLSSMLLFLCHVCFHQLMFLAVQLFWWLLLNEAALAVLASISAASNWK
jgi:hypothetical protein